MSKSIYDPKLLELWRDRALKFELGELQRRRSAKAKRAVAASFTNASKKTQRVEGMDKKVS
jgi:hypothetical protein